MQHDHSMTKVGFRNHPRVVGGGGGGLQAKYLLPCYFIRVSIKFDMQHNHVLKKLNFDPGSGGGGGVGMRVKIFATMLLHALFLLI